MPGAALHKHQGILGFAASAEASQQPDCEPHQQHGAALCSVIRVGVLPWHAKVLLGKSVVTQGFAASVEASQLFSAAWG